MRTLSFSSLVNLPRSGLVLAFAILLTYTPHTSLFEAVGAAQPASDLAVEWSQFGQNAARTNASPQVPSGQFQFVWDWNSADQTGKAQADHRFVPDFVQPVVGGGRVYIVADNAVFALDEATGAELWMQNGVGALTATPAYRNESLYLGSLDGYVYQLDAQTGGISRRVNLSAPIATALLITDTMVVAAVQTGLVTALDPNSLDLLWQYDAGGEIATTPAYSRTRDLVIIVAKDLMVHAIDAVDGTGNWRVKPTVRDYSIASEEGDYTVADGGWPVIAEQHGVVFVRYRLEWNTLWAFSPYPTTNADIRAALIAEPRQQALFALSLDTGETAFVPAVGNGGAGDGGMLPMGPMPVIREVDGQEVAYIIWRNGQTCAESFCDGREDAAMGEMVLDDTTVDGYQAGDVRFVEFDDIQTDEMMSLTMVGDVLFHSHWLINAGRRIEDRSPVFGAAFDQPVPTSDGLYVIWRQCNCPAGDSCNPIVYPGGSGTTTCGVSCPFNARTRYCPAGLYSYGDQRGYPPGFYQYHNDLPHESTIPFTISSGDGLIVKTRDGGLMAFTSGARSQVPQTQVIAYRQSHSTTHPLTIPAISYPEAMDYVGQVAKVCGTINSVVDHLPKALYMSFSRVHDGQMLVRIFQKDLPRFTYDPKSLLGQSVCITGLMRLYYPELNAPEIIVEDPRQIVSFTSD